MDKGCQFIDSTAQVGIAAGNKYPACSVVNFCSGDPNGYRNTARTNRLHQSDFRKLDLLLLPDYLEQLPLPFVVGLLTDTTLPALCLDAVDAAATLRDQHDPHCQFILLVEGLYVFTQKNADSVFNHRVGFFYTLLDSMLTLVLKSNLNKSHNLFYKIVICSLFYS